MNVPPITMQRRRGGGQSPAHSPRSPRSPRTPRGTRRSRRLSHKYGGQSEVLVNPLISAGFNQYTAQLGQFAPDESRERSGAATTSVYFHERSLRRKSRRLSRGPSLASGAVKEGTVKAARGDIEWAQDVSGAHPMASAPSTDATAGDAPSNRTHWRYSARPPQEAMNVLKSLSGAAASGDLSGAAAAAAAAAAGDASHSLSSLVTAGTLPGTLSYAEAAIDSPPVDLKIGSSMSDNAIPLRLILDLFRDFVQISLLALTAVKFLPPSVPLTVGVSIYSLLSFDITFIFTALKSSFSPSFLLYAITGLVLLVLFKRALRRDPSAHAGGIEATDDWNTRGCCMRNWRKILLFVMLTLYQPLITATIGVLVMDESVTRPCDEYSSTLVFLLIAGVVLALYGLVLPVVLGLVSLRKSPTLAKYDASGAVASYTTARFKAALAADNGPYKSLYSDFHKRGVIYKACVLVLKLELIVCVVVFQGDNCVPFYGDAPRKLADGESEEVWLPVVRLALLVIVLVVFVASELRVKPFLSSTALKLELFGKATAGVIICVGILALAVDEAALVASFTVASLALLALFVFVSVGVYSADYTKRALRRIFLRLDFTRSDGAQRADVFADAESIELNRMLREHIWMPFWDALFWRDTRFALPAKNEKQERKRERGVSYDRVVVSTFDVASRVDVPPYVVRPCFRAYERLDENRRIMSKMGTTSYERALKPLADDERALRDAIARDVLGPDVFVDAARCDTHFARVMAIPFPYVLFAKDDGNSVSTIKGGDMRALRRLYDKNMRDEEVNRRRGVRLSLRALEGSKCYFYHQETRMKSKSRTGSDGKVQYYTVSVTLTFEWGKAMIARRESVVFADVDLGNGLDFSLYYKDGHGTDSEGTSYCNEVTTVKAKKLGIKHNYEHTSNLARLLSKNAGIVEQQMPRVLDAICQWREHFVQEAAYKCGALSYDFHARVYLAWPVSRRVLIEALEAEENEHVRALPHTDRAAFDALYARLDLVTQSPARTLWFLFFSDLWRRNARFFPSLRTAEQRMSPAYADSLAYAEPMSRDALEELLGGLGLFSSSPLRQRLIRRSLLDTLYERLDAIKEIYNKIEDV